MNQSNQKEQQSAVLEGQSMSFTAANIQNVALVKEGLKCVKEGNHRDAISKFQEALKKLNLNPSDKAKIHMYMGISFKKLGEHENAVHFFKEAINLDPENPSILFNMANCKKEMNDFKGAIADYKKAQGLFNNKHDTDKVKLCEKRIGEIQGQIQKEQKDKVEVNKILKYQQAQIHIERARKYTNEKNYQNAIFELYQVSDLTPNDPLIHVYIGNNHNAMKNHNEAIDSYNNAIELDPKCALAYLNRANCEKGMGKLDEALKDNEKALKLLKAKNDQKNVEICERRISQIKKALSLINLQSMNSQPGNSGSLSLG